jgi:hypothetical protein
VTMFADSAALLDEPEEMLRGCYRVGSERPLVPALIGEVIGG